MIKTTLFIGLLTECQAYGDVECGEKPKVNDSRVTETCEEWGENGKCSRFSYYCVDDWATKPAVLDKDGNKVTFSSLSCMESEDSSKVLISRCKMLIFLLVSLYQNYCSLDWFLGWLWILS